MRTYDRTWLMTSVVEARKRVAMLGHFAGGQSPDDRHYLRLCTALHEPTGTVMAFTRDVGHHASGWWKNPDYERCKHLSLSFLDPTTRQRAPRDRKLTKEWVGLFFGADASKLWCEPPYTPEGRAIEVWHYRLFCDPAWEGIVPRGEVYNRELTEAGWKSYSDVRADLEQAEALAREVTS